MTIYVIFASSIAVALLIFIAVKLYAMERNIVQLLELLRKKREAADVSAPVTPVAPAGQTINVNLGTGQLVAPGIERVVTSAGEQAAAKEKADAEDTAESAMSEKSVKAEQPKATPVGSFALKCPKCKAENSVYRNECFNCGTPLR